MAGRAIIHYGKIRHRVKAAERSCKDCPMDGDTTDQEMDYKKSMFMQ